MSPALREAAEALRQRYGLQALPGEVRTWAALVKAILGRGSNSEKLEERWHQLAETPIASAAETEASTVTEIEEILEQLGRFPRAAALLKKLAAWWLRHADGDHWIEPNQDSRSTAQLEALREELKGISGLGVEQADRILLFVIGLAAYPLDRSSLRVACRHGWLDPESTYEECESFFVQGLEGEPNDLQQLSLWAAKTGNEFCGPQPKCERCPLQPFLPAGGPYHSDDR